MTESVQRSLMTLCDEHCRRTRRVVTSIAVPPGTIELGDLAFVHGGFQLVHLAELEGIQEPTVLSDREGRPHEWR